MSKSKLGAVVVLNDSNQIHRIFTDGDLRRLIEKDEGIIHNKQLSDLETNTPFSIDVSATLLDAVNLCKLNQVDNLVVKNNDNLIGIVDIQDLI